MKNFKEIAEKCLKGELSGTFVCIIGKPNGKIVNVPSKRLQKIIGFWPYAFILNYSDTEVSYDKYDQFGMTEYGHCEVINFIPDMKENDKRTIQITLCQAREWYNSGNDTLKTLALSSFSKQELDPYPRSWSAYLESHPGLLLSLIAPEPMCSKLMAYSKLLLLREEWIHVWSQEQGLEKDWEPNWNDSNEIKYVIMLKSKELGGIVVDDRTLWSSPLSFPTEELATNFMNTFKSLLEQAKGLY